MKKCFCFFAAIIITVTALSQSSDLQQGRYYFENRNYTAAIPYLQRAAKAGNAEAQYLIGWMYFNGSGVEENHQIGKTMTLRAAQQGLTSAYKQMGDFENAEKNFSKAAEYYTKAVEKGSVSARNSLAYYYKYGIGVEKDATKAFLLYSDNVEAGDAFAMCQLGYCYYRGIGVEQNKEKAYQWVAKSLESAQYCFALELMGDMYMHGAGVKKDESKAVEYFETVSNPESCNSSVGQYYLGKAYFEGKGVEKDPISAFKWFSKSADQGDIDAIYYLGLFYEDGIGITSNKQRAFEYYQKAGNGGQISALEKLVSFYAEGIGVQRDVAKAFEIAQKVSSSSDKGKYVLGYCYDKGIGVERDVVKARELYKNAADAGNENAEEALAILELEDAKAEATAKGFISVYDMAVDFFNKQDYNNALKYLMLTTETDIRSVELIGRMYYEGIGIEKNLHNAFLYFNHAAQNGLATSQAMVGKMYYEAEGVEKNKRLSLEWSLKASKQGNEQGRQQYELYSKYKEIGDRIDGGIVFYVDDSKMHGWLVCDNYIYTRSEFGCPIPNGGGRWKWKLPTVDQLKVIFNLESTLGLRLKGNVFYLSSETVPNKVLPNKPYRVAMKPGGYTRNIAYGNDIYTISVAQF